MTALSNPARDPAWTCRPAPAVVVDFHRSLPGYAPTRLTDLHTSGAARVLAKDESNRFGLPAFKALGASWAIHRALRERRPSAAADPVTIVTATDGNHGRAVARFAREFGHRASVYVPNGVPPAAVSAIRAEGATVTHVRGTYDDAVRAAARVTDGILVQDTAWAGYEEIPGWIVDGYGTLFAELDDQLRAAGIERPDLVVVPAGVGSLLQAALTHYRSLGTAAGTAVVSVEPDTAACVAASVAAGHPVTVATGRTVMAGLNCGTVSSLAWPYIGPGLDACVTVSDDAALAAVHELAALGVDAGPCGAAPFAALPALRDRLAGTVVLLVTEGAAAAGAESPSPAASASC